MPPTSNTPSASIIAIGGNYGSHAGHTPLARAALENRDTTAAYLTERGANISNIDKRGDTVVSTTVQNGSKKVLRLLLKNGADYVTHNVNRYTILQVAADYRVVTIGTLNLLQEARLKGLDTDAKCLAGLTALRLLQAREDVDDVFLWCFVAMLERVEPPGPRVYGPKGEYVWPTTLM